ncbi:MAG: polysaccharide deacetylase family protein [Blautia marasmi]
MIASPLMMDPVILQTVFWIVWKQQCKSYFFLAGRWNILEPVKRMEELGCEIGNHSYDHPDLTTLRR